MNKHGAETGALLVFDVKSLQEVVKVLQAELQGLMHDSVALHEKDVKALQTELLAVQTDLEGLSHDLVALHVTDVKALQTELLAVRDVVGAWREMDVKSF